MIRGAVVATVLLSVLTIAGCSSHEEATDATASSAAALPSPSPSPTPSEVLWAGEVCIAKDRFARSVSNLGQNLDYDITSDASALDQIEQQLRIQVMAVADAADRLKSTLVMVPVDAVEANDALTSLSKGSTDTKEAIDSTVTHLNAMTSADNVISAGAELVQAIGSAKAAYESGRATVDLARSLTDSATGQMKTAFDAAPECQQP